MNRFVALVGFLLLVVGGGSLIGMFNVPGEWYAQLAKPPFNPPNWVFGPAWTTLYILIAIAGWRVWQSEPRGTLAKLWWGQLALNFLWSPVFFTAHSIEGALVVILALLALILAFIATAWRRDRIAALLFVPYAAWVAFASTLNGSIALLN
jgi:benzodiazapine receptor